MAAISVTKLHVQRNKITRAKGVSVTGDQLRHRVQVITGANVVQTSLLKQTFTVNVYILHIHKDRDARAISLV